MRIPLAITVFLLLITLNLAAASGQRGDDVPLRNWPVLFDRIVRSAPSASTGRLHPATTLFPLHLRPSLRCRPAMCGRYAQLERTVRRTEAGGRNLTLLCDSE